MSKLRVSVKQLNQFGVKNQQAIGGCPRQWGFNYLDRLKNDWLAPQLVDGIKFHACVESLHRDDVMPAPRVLQPGVVLSAEDVQPEGHFGRMARAAIVHVPRREYGAWVHEHVGFFPWTTTNGVEVEIDFRPDLMSAPEPTMGYLVDFKSTGNKRHALTGDGGKKPLRDDVQANVYSHGMHVLGATCTLARWVYVDRNTYASWVVERLFTSASVVSWMHENLDATIELIHAFRTAPQQLGGLDLPANEEACGGTGRFCDHAGRCLTNAIGAAPSRLISLAEITRFIGQ